MKNRLFPVVVVLMISILACGLPAGGSGDQPDVQTTIPPSEQAEAQGELFLSAPNLATIELLTDAKGGGGKPLLAWEPVSGVSRYQLIVFDEAGEPYWAWEGTKTRIYMGGTDNQPPDESSGPSIEAGYSWTVVANGSDGKVLAASEIRLISP